MDIRFNPSLFNWNINIPPLWGNEKQHNTPLMDTGKPQDRSSALEAQQNSEPVQDQKEPTSVSPLLDYLSQEYLASGMVSGPSQAREFAYIAVRALAQKGRIDVKQWPDESLKGNRIDIKA